MDKLGKVKSNSDNWYSGIIKLSRDGKHIRIEDLNLEDGLKVNHLTVDTSIIGDVLSAVETLEPFNPQELISNSELKIRDFEVTLSPERIGKIVRCVLPPQLSGFTMEFMSGKLHVSGKYKLSSLLPTVPFSADMIPSVTDRGEARFIIDNVHLLGILPLPSFIKFFIAPLISSLFPGKDKALYSVDVDSVTVKLDSVKFRKIKISEDGITFSGEVENLQ